MVMRRSVTVAGGGIGGLAAAAAMAGRGFDVTVVERASRIDSGGSGLVLHPNGVWAADALGGQIGSRVRAAGHVTADDEVRVLMDASGTVLAEEPIGATGRKFGAPQISVLRRALHRALLDEALAAGASVRLATAVEDYLTHESHVSVRLGDDSTIVCDALVGADGIDSAVRRRMLGDGPPQYRGYTSVRGRTSGSVLGQRGHVVSGRGVQLFVTPVGGGTLHWTAKITSPAGIWPPLGPATAQRRLTETLEGWYGPVVALVRDADSADIVVTDIYDRDPVSRWTDGRVVLLGDAAHPMVPALGQGANMALEDAIVLADAMASHPSVTAALDAYARERVGRAASVVLRSRHRGSLDEVTDRAAVSRRNARTRSAGRKDADPGLTAVVGWRPRSVRRERPRPFEATAADHPKEGVHAMRAPHIVLVSGSLRVGSTSDQVAGWCARECADRGATVRVFTGAEIDFPAYRPGIGATHEGVAGFLEELRRADGVVLVSPTYHATVSGLLKNALDCVNDIDGPLPYLDGRAIGTVAVGAGAQGAVATLTTLRTIGHALRGWPTPSGVTMTKVPVRPTADGPLSPDGERLAQMVSQLMWLAGTRAAATRPALLGAAA
ncbi:NAD(P)H-dependent oxidoreductase [Streptomyces sp. NPDC051567]|uniref:NAD(P)H-dependent oxidoreductase n=1 Tax=Streptomyces sp. NPDC051567 TaxID=3365660 RepID=UPI0037B3FD84